MRISVLLSTYNAPRFLRNVLIGYAQQTLRNFEIVVADDGSTTETREMLQSLARDAPFNLVHCWHEDRGFRKTVILNRAIGMASGDYLIFSDGDCIPRKDFVQVHAAKARPDCFLSGGVEYLSKTATEAICDRMIETQDLFDPAWLSENRDRPRVFGKVNRSAVVQGLLRRFSPAAPTFNGHNTSAWKQDISSVNGFDERMAYGGLDRELGERLTNNGVKGVSVRYDAILAHQWHRRPYATDDGWRANARIRSDVKARKMRWTEWGIEHGPHGDDGLDRVSSYGAATASSVSF